MSTNEQALRVRVPGCRGDLPGVRTRRCDRGGSRSPGGFGVVEELGSEVSGLQRGDLVVSPFAYSDNTCESCREGPHTSCRHGGFWGTPEVGGAQAEAILVPQAFGTLVEFPGVGEDSPLLPSLLPLADVYGTGYHAAKRAHVTPRSTVTVIGDGAVGLLAVLSAKQLSAERIILMGRHGPGP